MQLASKLKINLPELNGNTLTIIPTFNNPTYAKFMTDQCRSYGLKNIIILDGGSTYLPMTKLLKRFSDEFLVIDLPFNPGPRLVMQSKVILDALPKTFILTDPDLQFNSKLPMDFLFSLEKISDELKLGKVGFALDISQPKKMRDEKFKINEDLYSISEWESQFWRNKINHPLSFEIYSAPVDTTFALYNQDFFDSENSLDAIRVAGDFTAIHLPWMRSTIVPKEENEFYTGTQRWSYYSLR